MFRLKIIENSRISYDFSEAQNSNQHWGFYAIMGCFVFTVVYLKTFLDTRFLGLNLAFSGIPRKTVVSTKDVTGLLDAHFHKKYKKSIKTCEMIINTKSS